MTGPGHRTFPLRLRVASGSNLHKWGTHQSHHRRIPLHPLQRIRRLPLLGDRERRKSRKAAYILELRQPQ